MGLLYKFNLMSYITEFSLETFINFELKLKNAKKEDIDDM